MKKRVMVFMFFCLLLGCVSSCGKAEQGKEDEGSKLVETTISYLQDLSYFYSMCQTDEGSYLVFGTQEASEEPFAVYSSTDGGSSWEKQNTGWSRDIEALSGDDIMIMGGDMTKEQSLAVFYRVIDEEGNTKETHILLMESEQQVADILLDTDIEVMGLRISDDGNGVFVHCGNSVAYYDKDGNLKQSYKQKGIIDFLERENDILLLSEEQLCIFNKETGDLEKQDTLFTEELSQELEETAERIRGISLSTPHVMKNGTGDECYFLLLTAGIYKHVPGESETECLVDGNRNSFAYSQMTIMDYVVRADDDIVVLGTGTNPSMICYTTAEAAPEPAAVPEPVTAPASEGTGNNFFADYHSSYVEEINEDLTGTVTVYCLQSSSVVQEMINVYQRTHPNVEVQLVIGMDEDSNITVDQAVVSLNTELLSGNGPDVIIMDGLNVREYQEKGLLLELSDLYGDINQKFELMTNITESYMTEEGIYAIPAHVSPTLMLGKQDIVEQMDTMEELAEYVEKNDSLIGNSLSMYTWEQLYNVLYPCVSNQILNDDNKYDSVKMEQFIKNFKRIWKTLEKQLEEHGDRWQYEDLKENFAEERGINLDSYLLLNLNNLAMPEISGQSLGIGRIYKNINFTLMFGIARKQPDYIYCPLSLGDKAVYTPVAIAAINAGSSNIELARDFVSEMFAPTEQEVAGSMVEGIPVNWEGLSLSCYYNSNAWSSWVGGWLEEHGGTLYEVGAHIESQEEYTYFKEYLNQLETPVNINAIVSGFIQENMEAYLSDEISDEEYMKQLEEKLVIYLSE